MMSYNGLPVLTFHSFGRSRAVHFADPLWFDETLGMLVEAGFHCVDLGDWVDHACPREPRGYAIAIDDGLRSILKITDSLSRHNATATVFLVTDRVGSDNAWPGQPSWVPIEPLLSWDEVRELTRLGLKFASHTGSHARLDLCELPFVEVELRGSRDTIEERLGSPCRLVAYPYGASTTRSRLITSRYYQAGFGTRLDFTDSGQDPFDLARLDAYYLRSNRLRSALVNGEAREPLKFRSTLRNIRQSAVSALLRSAS